jgi:hypothetical protein
VEELEKNFRLRINHHYDQFLMHLIQEVTKRPAVEILNFFYELAGQVARVGLEKKKGRGGIAKEIVDYFPDTSIPFLMTVKGGQKRASYIWDPTTRQQVQTDGEAHECTAEVGFPEGRSFIPEAKLKEISEALMERALLDAPLDGIEVPTFVRPEIRSSKMFVDLMNSFAGRPPRERKRRKKKSDGNTTTTTS